MSFLVSPLGSVVAEPVNQTVHYRDSANFKFTCTGDGGPDNEYRWIKGSDTSALDDGVPLNVIDKLNSLATNMVSDSYQLALFDITGENVGGVYTCIVINKAGYGTSSVTLALYVSPVIILDPEDQFVEYGDSVNITCEAESYPSPTYQWEKMDRITAIFEELEGETDRTIVFPSVKFEDYGRYRCVVTTPIIELKAASSSSVITGILILL